MNEGLKTWLTFLSALLGGAVGAPLIEWFKVQIAAGQRWKEQREEIVSTLRLTLGLFKAFEELRSDALERPPLNMQSFSCMMRFEFEPIYDNIAKLSALHPKSASKSAAGQRLVQHLTVVASYYEQLKSIVPITIIDLVDHGNKRLGLSEEDRALLKMGKKKADRMEHFLIGVYSTRMGIDSLSLVIDKEILMFELNVEHEIHKREMEEALERLVDRDQVDGELVKSTPQTQSDT